MPHLTELQKKYPQVTILGVAVWEENIDNVHKFVSEMGDKMDYSVAYNIVAEDEKEGDVTLNWLNPAYQNGIPSAFLIDQNGKIAWFGHPVEIDSVLEKVVNKEFDIVKATEDYKAYLISNQIRERKQLGNLIRSHLGENDIEAAIREFDIAFSNNIDLEKFMGIHKLDLLLKSNNDKHSLDYAKHLISFAPEDDIEILQKIGGQIVFAFERYKDNEKIKSSELLDFAIKILIQVEDKLTPTPENYYSKCINLNSLVRAFLVKGEPENALKYAQLGLDYAIKGELKEDLYNLFKDFILNCSEQIKTTGTHNSNFICDENGCRLK
ncbi:hypothetical protein NYY63_08975 [Acinetobacter lactucae]